MIGSILAALGPTGFATVVGGTAGAGGAVLAQIVVAVSTDRRDQRSRLFDEWKVAYPEYLRAVSELQQRTLHGTSADETSEIDQRLLAKVEIIASRRVQKEYTKTIAELGKLVEAKEAFAVRLGPDVVDGQTVKPDAEFQLAHERMERQMRALEKAMRNDLGVP